jgi:hypothetical protein
MNRLLWMATVAALLAISVASSSAAASMLLFSYSGVEISGSGTLVGSFELDSSLLNNPVQNNNLQSLSFTATVSAGTVTFGEADIAINASTIFGSGPSVVDGSGYLTNNGVSALSIEPNNEFAFYFDDLFAPPSSWFEGTWTVSQTPIPAALPLFATGLGGLGLLGWRRKRKQATA